MSRDVVCSLAAATMGDVLVPPWRSMTWGLFVTKPPQQVSP